MTGGDLPALPYLAPWYRVVQAEDKVVLEHGQRIVVLEGGATRRLVPAVLALLDGTRTVDEIVGTLGRPSRPAVENVLEVLAGQGLLVDGPPLPGDEPRPFADAAALLASLSPGSPTVRRGAVADAAGALRRCSVGVAGDSAAAAEVARLLRVSGVGVERSDGPATGVDLTVCAPAAHELPRLPAWNDLALASALPWLQLLPFDGRYAAVGPLYLPGDTCCHECFRRRRAANLDAGDELTLLDRTPATYPAAPAVDALAAAVAAQLALGWLVLGDHYAPAAMYALELVPTIALTVHHVHRVPRCPACSSLAAESAPLPWHKEIPVAEGARA
jgi:bacteriocin biosynthesis cyclodehydratase domain-containing protein